MGEQPLRVLSRASRRRPGAKGPALIARNTLDIFDDRLEFGSWRLPVAGIREARFERRLYRRDGRWAPENNRLRLTCGEYEYKFRFEALEDLREHLPFPFEDREIRLKPAGPLVYVIILGLLALAYGANGLFS